MATSKTPKLDPDFKEFIALLNSEGVRYLLLGGYAVNLYGHHRATGDIDFWIAIDAQNAQRVSKALQRFGFSPGSVKPEAFMEPNKVHMFGRSPTRVDLLSGPSGVEFDQCYARRISFNIDGVLVPVISLDDLLANKLASGRAKDLADVEVLSKAKRPMDKG
jgi:Nucleotidyl transferase AbiEii toxin, Type IV TA system